MNRPSTILLRTAPLGALLALAACDEVMAPSPRLSLSEATVEFRAVRGTEDPVARTISVQNAGGGRLGPVSCPQEPAEWLTCSVANGSMVTLTANPVGLDGDPSPVTVPLSAPGGTAQVEVRFVIDQPVLAVSPGTLTFTAAEGETEVTPSAATITVSNTGAGTVANLGTLECAPTETTSNVICAVNPGVGTITVAASAAGLPPGNRVFTLRVSAEHSQVEQDVVVTVAVAPGPRIGLSREFVQFEAVRGGAVPSAQTVTVSNTGDGTLGTLSCPASPAGWLTCAISGSTVTLSVNQSGLTQDPAPVQVPISAAGALNSPRNVEVSLRLQQPVLALSRGSLSFTAAPGDSLASPASDTLTALNTGAGGGAALGALACSVPAGSPVACSLDQASRVIQVSVNPFGVAPGQHVFPVEITAANSDVTRTLNVQLQVGNPPTLVLSPSVRHFSAVRGSTTPLTQSVTVSNAGTGSLGTITCPADPESWLSCAVVDSTQITLAADPSGLTSSPAAASVPVTASGDAGSPRNIEVTFAIQQPILTLSATGAEFTDAGGGTTTPASVVITASNTGAGTLESLGDLTCTVAAPAACSVDPGTGELTFVFDPTGLASGTHVRIATVTAPNAGNGSRTVTLVLTVP